VALAALLAMLTGIAVLAAIVFGLLTFWWWGPPALAVAGGSATLLAWLTPDAPECADDDADR